MREFISQRGNIKVEKNGFGYKKVFKERKIESRKIVTDK